MSPIEQAVIDAIDEAALLRSLSELIALDSSNGQEIDIQLDMAERLTGMGMDVDLWEIDLPRMQQHPAWGVEIQRERALGLVAMFGSAQGPRLVLNGHVDVVPAGELDRWTMPPFVGTVRDGRVYGRGSADMKGGLCCAMAAVKAIAAAGVRLRGQVQIQSVVGEEDGGLGTLATIVRGHRGDAAIVMEPTELMIAPAQAGALSFRIVIPGQAAHGALRIEGVDPLGHFPRIYSALAALEAERNRRLAHPLFADYAVPFAICIGKARAGIWASTVAEALVLEGRYGLAIGEDPETAQLELEAALRGAGMGDPWLERNPPHIEWWGARYLPAAIDVDHTLVRALAKGLTEVTDRAAVIRGMPYGADMHLLVHHARTPTVLFGPGNVRVAHAPDEFVPIEELLTTTRSLALAILRFCGMVR
ncbi:MAG: ArgE/DapE family deacylase [Pseudomonadota bacterium]|nr:MAG: ArgE/DapE family deacylase [Pseudomonadota bacterium]